MWFGELHNARSSDYHDFASSENGLWLLSDWPSKFIKRVARLSVGRLDGFAVSGRLTYVKNLHQTPSRIDNTNVRNRPHGMTFPFGFEGRISAVNIYWTDDLRALRRTNDRTFNCEGVQWLPLLDYNLDTIHL